METEAEPRVIHSHLVKTAYLLRSSNLFGDLVYGACVIENVEDSEWVRRNVAANPTVTSKFVLHEGGSIDQAIFEVISTADGAQALENDLRYIINQLKEADHAA